MANPAPGPTTESGHHTRNRHAWLAYDAAFDEIRKTLDAYDELKLDREDIDNLEEAIRYHDRYTGEISDRLKKDEDQTLLLKYRLSERVADIKRLKESANIGLDRVTQQVNEIKIKKIADSEAEIWAAVHEIFHDRIQQEIQDAKPLPSNYKPDDQRASIFRSFAAPHQVGEQPSGWSAKDIFNVLYEEVAKRRDDSARVETLKRDRDDLRDERNDAQRRLGEERDSFNKQQKYLEADAQAKEASHQEELQQVQRDLAAAHTTIEERNGDIERLKQDAKEPEEQIVTLKSKLEDAEERALDLEEVREQLNKTAQELSELQQDHEVQQAAWESEREELTNTAGEDKETLSKRLETLQNDMKEAEDSHRRAEDTLIDLFAKILRHTLYGKEWWVGAYDLRPLGKLFPATMLYIRSVNPPGNWNLSKQGQHAEFANTIVLEAAPVSSELGTLMCQCLSMNWVGASSSRELRSRLKWVDETLMPRYLAEPRKTGLRGEDEVLLVCLVRYLVQLMMASQGDGVSVAWASCLIVQLLCTHEIDVGEVSAFSQRTLEQCTLLEAAGIIRLQMAAHEVSKRRANTATIDMPDVQDVRFKSGLAQLTECFVLDMCSFLDDVCPTDIIGTSRQDEWFITVSDGQNRVIAVAEHGNAHYFLRHGSSTTFRSGDKGLHLSGYVEGKGRAAWVAGNGKECVIHYTNTLHRFLAIFQNTEVRKELTHESWDVWTRESRKQRQLKEQLEIMGHAG